MLRYTNLREVRQILSYKRCLPLTTLCVDDDKGATKVLSSSLTRGRPFQLNAAAREWRHLADRLERSHADRYRKSDIVFDFKPPVCVLQGV